MAELHCVDGTVLTVLPVPCLGRDGVPYEVTLRLLRDGAEVGAVGERCGWFLASAAAQVRTAHGLLEACSQDQAVRHHLPRDRELLALRSRDPDDVAATGELRVVLREERSWEGAAGWTLRSLAVVEVWDGAGRGACSQLDREGLLGFLDALLADCAAVGVPYDDVAVG